ncbi:hypothetical protein GCM10023340_35440 [Nocardioides marinquilinus]|uniref:Uncharacterized protein n=2 Tax=Nocardioides marinquilinus TaxID=1210400 RepID=A0ABP9PZ24_9ACTN
MVARLRVMRWTAVADDGWVRWCLLVGALLVALSVFEPLPWALWLGWAYLLLVCAADVPGGGGGQRHSPASQPLWQTRDDE